MIGDAQVRTISANVRRLAAERGIALAHLADRAGIGRTTMWRLLDVNERGPSDPRLSTIVALARALDVEVIDLLAESHCDRGSMTPPADARVADFAARLPGAVATPGLGRSAIGPTK